MVNNHAFGLKLLDLFEGVVDALGFAFNLSKLQGQEKSFMLEILNKYAKQEYIQSSGKGLVGIDAAAQAGMIKAAVKRLPHDSQVYIYARFDSDKDLCKCCHEYTQKTYLCQEALAYFASTMEQFSGMNQTSACKLCYAVINRKKVNYEEFASFQDIGSRQLRNKVKTMKKHFAKLENQALAELHGLLFDDR